MWVDHIKTMCRVTSLVTLNFDLKVKLLLF